MPGTQCELLQRNNGGNERFGRTQVRLGQAKTLSLLKSWLGWNPVEIMEVQLGVPKRFFVTAISPETIVVRKAFTGAGQSQARPGRARRASWERGAASKAPGPACPGDFASPARFSGGSADSFPVTMMNGRSGLGTCFGTSASGSSRKILPLLSAHTEWRCP